MNLQTLTKLPRFVQEPPAVRKRLPLASTIQKIQSQIISELKNQGLQMPPKEVMMQFMENFPTFVASNRYKGILTPKQGIFLYGTTGVGKTTLFRSALRNVPSTIVTSSREVISDMESFPDFLRSEIINHSTKHFYLDDLGAERDNVKRFGTTVSMTDWMEWRYEAYKEHGSLTYITSNLDMNGIRQRYGQRVYSRLSEMTFPVLYNWTDRRVQNG